MHNTDATPPKSLPTHMAAPDLQQLKLLRAQHRAALAEARQADAELRLAQAVTEQRAASLRQAAQELNEYEAGLKRAYSLTDQDLIADADGAITRVS